MIDASIYDLLTSDTAVAAIVGTKIYPVQAPKNAVAPWIRWQRISRVQGRDLGRVGGLVRTRVQFDCIDENYTASRQLADAVVAAIQNWTSVTEGIDDADTENMRDSYEQIADVIAQVSVIGFGDDALFRLARAG